MMQMERRLPPPEDEDKMQKRAIASSQEEEDKVKMVGNDIFSRPGDLSKNRTCKKIGLKR